MISLLLVILLAVVNAWVDYRIIQQGTSPNYRYEVILRGIYILAAATLNKGTFWETVLWFIAGAALFWILFEMILNKLRGRELLYVGITAKTDLFFRKYFPKNPGRSMLIIKFTILIISLCFLILF